MFSIMVGCPSVRGVARSTFELARKRSAFLSAFAVDWSTVLGAGEKEAAITRNSARARSRSTMFQLLERVFIDSTTSGG